MSKIYYIIGPSSSGKDTLYKRILTEDLLHLHRVTMYTTRPIRRGEQEGEAYFFVDTKRYEELVAAGAVIESRGYDTVHGLWYYFTVDDHSISLDEYDYLMIGVVDSFEKTREYYGADKVVPIYIQVEDGIRLQRALTRETKQEQPKYKEMCRRYLADIEDFSEERLEQAGITRMFCNVDLEKCTQEIITYIQTIQHENK